jgi:GNAT superfamily N-acetyltransferase
MDFKHTKLANIGPGLIFRTLCESYKGWSDFPKYEEEWNKFDKDIHDYSDSIGSSGFGTILGESLIGFISWDGRQFPLYVIIGHNCVLPGFRNRGVGKYQLSSALTQLDKMGFYHARVSTKRSKFFMYARMMYESCGFVECAPYRNDGVNMIYYSQELKNR